MTGSRRATAKVRQTGGRAGKQTDTQTERHRQGTEIDRRDGRDRERPRDRSTETRREREREKARKAALAARVRNRAAAEWAKPT